MIKIVIRKNDISDHSDIFHVDRYWRQTRFDVRYSNSQDVKNESEMGRAFIISFW